MGLPYLEHAFQDLFPGTGLRAFSAPVTTDPELGQRLAQAMAQAEATPQAMEQLLLPVLYELFSRHASPNMPTLPAAGGISAVQRVKEFMRTHPDENPRLETLADLAGLSKYHFLRVFKKHTHLTPHAYMLRQRVAHARKMLEQGSSPLEAAMQSGFSDQSHLTRCFKAMYGLTPGKFLSQS